MSTLQAGVSRKIISPPTGIYLMGYGNRVQGNVAVHDDIFATTIIFDNGSVRAALLTIDHTFINPKVVQQVQAEINTAVGIPAAAVFLCCSHTHAGPIGYADEYSRPEDHHYITFLVNQLVGSVVEAVAGLCPVTLTTATDFAHININRRERQTDGPIIIGQNPDGIVDSSVQVVQILTDTNKVLATLVNYACHPVVMGPLNRLVSADWVGAMRRSVEAAMGGVCLFMQGATADINPRKMRWAVDSWDEVEEQGKQVADAVSRAGWRLQPLSGTSITSQQQNQWLRLMPVHAYNKNLRAFLPADLSEEKIRAALHELFPWHTTLETRSDGVYSPIAIGSLYVGDWAVVTVGTEPFTETGLKVKAASSAKVTFFAGYTNGCNSYLPVTSAYTDGGYEVETAPLFYGLPAGFEQGSAEIVTEALIKLLRT